ncbi:AraC family transcriptional regulator [Evansella cellulosilytica]|uniref:Transcriptional regulator, AraC family n=1 Tax=Evansella cellulosilytica (strain ATCC 21833 / DSM 2522 / FERM P-1141 / JCM 9156 / N-4) TaxID=649639 RepID=E6U0Q4_EVAC2|nr:AraC family transcriptional regulator [Evansella cellulosilytica]ADU29102.1 transcriptional regulator, AraC family [Evansella cellulosilytica DSM 2522]
MPLKGQKTRETRVGRKEKQSIGYYEIDMTSRYHPQMQATVLAGNVMYNRLHWHEHVEIIYCVRGSFSLRVGGEVMKLSEGDFATINSDVPHEIFDGIEDGLQIIFSVEKSLLRKEEWEQYQFSTVGDYAVAKDCSDAQQFRKSVARMTWLVTLDRNQMIALEAAHKDFGKKIERDEWRELYSSSILQTEEEWYEYQMEVFHCLYCMAKHKSIEKNNVDRLQPKNQFRLCIELIHREYGSELDAKKLSEAVGVSEPTIYRMVQKNLGVSLNNYIQMVRIHAVCARLEQTDASITEVAFDCGFTSLSNFYRVFHELVGQTPREFRKGKQTKSVTLPGLQQNILELNRFQSFFELPFKRDDLLEL